LIVALNALFYSMAARAANHDLTMVSLPFLGSVGASVLILCLALIVIARWIISPIHTLQTQLQNLRGSISPERRIDLHRRDEIGELAAGINSLVLHGETAISESLQAHSIIEQIIKHAGIGIVALNHHGNLIILNQRLEEMLGCTHEKVETHGWFETIYKNAGERAAAREKWRQHLAGKLSTTEEWQIDAGYGEKKTLAVITVPIQKSDGKAIGTISFCHDTTKQKQLESQVEQSRRLAGLGTIAGGIAHNFNNILCAIIGYTTLGRERLPKDEPVREYFSIIEQSATRASQLTQQLLVFSKGGQTTMQLVDFRPLIHEVVSLLRETLPRHITIEEIYHHDWLFLKADSAQLHQCLMNICLNARDAMPDGGCITIDSTIRNYDAENIPSTDLAPGRYIRLEIKDTGIGMSEAIRQRVFEPFFTTKPSGKGTGLGLATVYGSIKSHRGHIEVISEEGRGTSFIIHLPALKDLFGEDAVQMPLSLPEQSVTVVRHVSGAIESAPIVEEQTDLLSSK
jgi:PAS domain S-box-containing protein